jgi:hypothetical protein
VSEVDTRFAPEARASLLDDVRSWLPAFLSSAATEQYDPAGDVRELLGLDEGDLRRVVAVHLCLSEPVRAFLAALAAGLRRPITSSERPPVVGQAVRGAVDWGATMRQRAVGAATAVYVTRPAQRIFDVPENRALAWLVRSLDGYLRRAVGGAFDADNERARWDAQLRAARGRLALAHRIRGCGSITTERPSAGTPVIRSVPGPTLAQEGNNPPSRRASRGTATGIRSGADPGACCIASRRLASVRRCTAKSERGNCPAGSGRIGWTRRVPGARLARTVVLYVAVLAVVPSAASAAGTACRAPGIPHRGVVRGRGRPVARGPRADIGRLGAC